ncbi:MAG TPA: transposase [Gaiellaceae bacterium]
MAQGPRDSEPGIHHVTVGATGPSEYYKDHIDRLDWLRRFIRILDRFGWTCLLVCQMTTHVHLILDVPDRSLSEGMQRLNGGYGKEFNERHGRRGGLVRRRFWSTRITTDEQLLAAFRYVALNPVRAGMCERAEEWFWSSFATSCGLATTFPFVEETRVLSLLDATPSEARRALLTLVRDV